MTTSIQISLERSWATVRERGSKRGNESAAVRPSVAALLYYSLDTVQI